MDAFAQVPTALLRDPRLSPAAKALAALLMSYGWSDGHCFPSQKTLADDLGKSIDTVQRVLDELERYGFVRTQRRRGMRGLVYHLAANYTPSPSISTVNNSENMRPESSDTANMRPTDTANMRPVQTKTQVTNIQNQQHSYKPTSGERGAENVVVAPEIKNPEETTSEEDPLHSRLLCIGFSAFDADVLLKNHDREIITAWLGVLPRLRDVANPAGYLRRALERGWKMPTLMPQRQNPDESQRQDASAPSTAPRERHDGKMALERQIDDATERRWTELQSRPDLLDAYFDRAEAIAVNLEFRPPIASIAKSFLREEVEAEIRARTAVAV